jgi:hypothetical protein
MSQKPSTYDRVLALLEDVTDLVFLEYYLLAIVAKHPDYSDQKWIEII